MPRPIDRSTVDRLVIEHLPLALRFASRLTGSADTAEDLVQESLCRVLRSWRSYRGDATFATWLLQIVVNVDRDRRRRQRIEYPLSSEFESRTTSPPLEQAAVNELQADVRAAIDALPERQREVALLSLGDGLPACDVALVLDTTEANVHTCLHLARKRIARVIGVDYSRQGPR
jgi:RNA polymerase sigma-70 factor (ECF subfamily)